MVSCRFKFEERGGVTVRWTVRDLGVGRVVEEIDEDGKGGEDHGG